MAFVVNIGLFLWWLFHPFYVSVTNIDYNETSKSLELSCRIFFDDLETGIRPVAFPDLDIANPKTNEKARVDSLVKQYLQKHLRVLVNDKPVALKYLGYRIEEDAAWCFLEAADVAKPKGLKVYNSILFDQFENQSNIIHLTVGKERKSTKLDNPKNLASFTF